MRPAAGQPPLGVRLLERSKSRVTLTEEGRSLLTDAQRILALATESILAVQRLSRGETGELNIAYLPNFDFEHCRSTEWLRKRSRSNFLLAMSLMGAAAMQQIRQASTTLLGIEE